MVDDSARTIRAAVTTLTIRRFDAADWPAVWAILQPTFAAGDTYAFPLDIAEGDARRLWTELPLATYVAATGDAAVRGTYYLKPNQQGPGAHVCNCGYVVAPAARGQGIASAMCEHSQREAASFGFRAMQFNLVVATNVGAVRLWQRLGFAIVGTLPGAFRHSRLGFIDAHVMYKTLAPAA